MHCSNRRTLARVPDSTPRANQQAEQIAGEHRATTHPDTHVHYDLPGAAFVVVAPEGGDAR